MGRLWATIAGINQYQFFQPLPYARQDAEALHRFLTRYGHLDPSCGVLLTDNSPAQENPQTRQTWGTHPSREGWWAWLQSLCTTDQLQPEDTLWVFFSGYGVHQKGEDYLMPSDGNPQAIPETGISVRSLLHLLHGARTHQILVLLDMSRSQGIFAPEQCPGQQTADLATQFNIPTILSCQPHQFAHETTDLRLGLFTAALLEGLRSDSVETFGELVLYLNDRVPELCDHHWKPLQLPLGLGSVTVPLYPKPFESSRSPVLETGVNPALELESPLPSPHLPPLPRIPVGIQTEPGADHPLPLATKTPTTGVPRFQYALATLPEDRPNARTFLLWFTIALATLGGLLWVTRWGNFRSTPPNSGINLETGSDGNTEKTGKTSETRSPATDNSLFYESLPSPSSIFESPNSESPNSLENDRNPVSQDEVSGDLSQNDLSQDDIAQDDVAQNQFILREARDRIRFHSASQFSEAIAQARQIRPGEPLYNQAQEDIDRWSQIIFDLALGRAQVQDYAGAIEAAKLVPTDRLIYTEAQKAIDYWTEQIVVPPAPPSP